MDEPRLVYTLQLVDILHEILPAGLEGSISTLPIAWGTPCMDLEQTQAAAEQLRAVALHMHQLEERSGRLIYLCLEPEPGCVFTFADDAVHFFTWQLFSGPDADIVRRLSPPSAGQRQRRDWYLRAQSGWVKRFRPPAR